MGARASRLCFPQCFLQTCHLLLSLLFTPRLWNHRTLFRNNILDLIFAYVEYAADLLRKHNLDACPPTMLYANSMPTIPCPTICLMPANPNAQTPCIIQNPKDLLEILYKRYAISQIDCLFHCLMPISFTNLFILISSASPSLSAYLSDRPLVSTRMYSIS